ncbi:Glycosyl_transferases group 1 family protein [Hexamita inflata]|uniref:Glycosyl transferases group 1 family protein n=1 Tax=Hexamita inflata TaxID=28002 RepID=A0AA86S6C0_9EUKA|nr:Glycosyl transferases group 1 family protein [Hexamita inflata]
MISILLLSFQTQVQFQPQIKAKAPKTRIAFVLMEFVGGGMERVTELLTRDLSKVDGFELFIVTTTTQIPNFIDENVTVLNINEQNAVEDINKIHKQYQIDIFVCQDHWRDINTELIRELKKEQAKVIAFEHNSFFMYLYFKKDELKHKTIAAYKEADAVICLSRTDAKIWQVVRAKAALYMPNLLTFDPKEITPATLEHKNILFIGRYDLVQKRSHIPIQILQKVNEMGKHNATLQILGNQNPEYQNFCQKVARECGVTNNVQFLGYQQDVQKYLQNASVLIMTSQFEGFPMIVAEAKAYGIPIVLMKMEYCEITKQGVIQVEKNDIDNMSNEINKLLNTVEYRRTKGNEGRESLKMFDNKLIIKRWTQLIKAVMKSEEKVQKIIPYGEEISVEDVQRIFAEETKASQDFVKYVSNMTSTGWYP